MDPGISIWNRLLGVMVVLLACVGGLFYWQAHSHANATDEFLQAEAKERREDFARTNRLISRTMEAFALELAQLPLSALPTDAAMTDAAAQADVDVYAIIDPAGNWLRAQDLSGKGQQDLLAQAIPMSALVEEGRSSLFFTLTPRGPLQCAFIPLAGEGAPSGYLLAGRYWDRVFLTQLGEATESIVQTFPISEVSARPTGFIEGRQYRVTEMGVGPLGKPIFAYSAIFDLSESAAALEGGQAKTRRIFLAVMGVLVLFFAVLWKWLAYPMRLVSEALEKDDPTVLKPILNEDYDWARIAQRLTESSEARLALTREVQRQQEEVRIQEETARVREALARDLHDGVIQSVYAVGLQLERANMMLDRDPEKSRTRLTECKDSLNGIIGELRGFIKGLTPEPLRGKSLEDALEQLVIHVRKSTEATIDLQISEEACDALSTAQALNLYQLSRELLSNAIRHAQAKLIRLRISHEGDRVVLRVSDNGVGFDPAKISRGSGLTNMQERARQIGAVIKFSSNTPNGSITHVSVPIDIR